MKKQKIYGSAEENEKANMADIRLPFTDCFVFMLVVIVRHIIVMLNPTNRIGDRIIDSKNIYDKMTAASALFPSPDPPLADFMILIKEYENTVLEVKKGAPEAEAKMNEAWEKLLNARKLLLNYVQSVCLKNHEKAEEIALSAGMAIKNVTTRNVPEFSVKALAGGGADLSSKVKVRGCAHQWECTLNPSDSKGWLEILIPPTLQGKTRVWGFTPGTTVYFRHRTIFREGPGPWSQIISIIIIK